MVASPWDIPFSWPFPPGMVGFRSSYLCVDLPSKPARMWKMQHFPWQIPYLQSCRHHSSLLVKLGSVWTKVPVPHKVKPREEKREFILLIRRALWHRFTSQQFFALAFTRGKQQGARWCQWVKGQGGSATQEQDRPSPSLSECQYHRAEASSSGCLSSKMGEF